MARARFFPGHDECFHQRYLRETVATPSTCYTSRDHPIRTPRPAPRAPRGTSRALLQCAEMPVRRRGAASRGLELWEGSSAPRCAPHSESVAIAGMVAAFFGTLVPAGGGRRFESARFSAPPHCPHDSPCLRSPRTPAPFAPLAPPEPLSSPIQLKRPRVLPSGVSVGATAATTPATAAPRSRVDCG